MAPAAIPPDIVSLEDYAVPARRAMGEAAWAYVSGGGADELTLRWNREDLDRIRLRSRVLADLRGAHTRVELFGQSMDVPVILAPVALHRLAHPEGERGTVLGAGTMGVTAVVSTQASQTLEEIAAAAPAPLWFQLYWQHDRGFTRALIRRAEAAGYRALVLTVDAAASLRNREQRAGFALPPGIETVNLRGLPPAPPFRAGPRDSHVFAGLLDHAPRWEDLDWLIRETRLPVLVKGVLDPDDAVRAVAAGAAGIVVSNHGGRVLDTVPAAINALPRVAGAVAGRVPVLMDGGVRRGTDVLKALALGARAVLVGRPVLHALAVAGPLGVAHALKLLRTELEVAMALTGCATVAAVDRGVLWDG